MINQNTPNLGAMGYPIISIFLSGSPFKIMQMIVGVIAIEMTGFMFRRRSRSGESFQNQNMNFPRQLTIVII